MIKQTTLPQINHFGNDTIESNLMFYLLIWSRNLLTLLDTRTSGCSASIVLVSCLSDQHNNPNIQKLSVQTSSQGDILLVTGDFNARFRIF